MSRTLLVLALWLLNAWPAHALAVWMNAPVNGDVFTAPVTLFVQAQAEAIDDGERVNTHRLYQNGAVIATGAYTVSATVTLSAGTYQFRSQATNNRGQTSSSDWVNITVLPPSNQYPVVSMGAPTGAPFIAPAPIGLSAAASDPDGTIARVVFYRDGTQIGVDTSAPFEASYTAPSAGTYTFWTIATDNVGATTTSGNVQVVVNPNAPPAITMTSPVNDAGYISPAVIPVAVNVADSDGWVTKVDFYANGAYLSTDTTAPFEASWSTGNIGGVRGLYALATDNKGAQTGAGAQVVLNGASGSLALSPNPCTVPNGSTCNTTLIWSSNDPASQVRRHYTHLVQTQEGPEWRDVTQVVGTGSSGSVPITIDRWNQNDYFDLIVGGSVYSEVYSIFNHPPWTTLTLPSNGQWFTTPAVIAMSATANDADGSIIKMEFYADGQLIATDNVPPYDFVWANAPIGVHTLTAVAYDNYGTKRDPGPTDASAEIWVNSRPTVSLTAPDDGALALPGQAVTLSAAAYDLDDMVTKVEFFADGALVGTTTGAPYSVSWTPPSVKSYSLSAVVTDYRGATGTSTTRTLIVNAPPVVSMTSPRSGKIYVAPAPVVLQANAIDTNGTVSKVEFFASGALVGTAVSAPYAYTWNGAASGAYMITAKATDNHGASTTSGPIKVSVMPAGSLVRSYVYDANHQLCKTIEPETGSTVSAYDGAGNVAWSASGLDLPNTASCDTSTAHSSGRRVDRTYTARNRLETLSFPDSNGNQVWNYTPDGLPSQVTTFNEGGISQVVNAFSYNKRRLPTGESQGQTGRSTWSIGYGYNVNGHLAAHVYPDGLSIDYAPNALGQATQAGPYAGGAAYYPNGALKQFTYGNGIAHTMTRNDRGLPERSLDSDGLTAVLDDSYDYDANGNVVAISDGLPGNRGNRDMTYDGLDRLVAASSPMFGTHPLIQFSYDGLENLRRVVGRGKDLTYVYDARNRLTNVTQTVGGETVVGLGYDLQGNLQNKSGQTYTFDYGNRLRNVIGKESYRYDGAGRRVMANANAGAGPIWSQYGLDGTLRFQQDVRTGLFHDYVYLAGSLVAKRTTTAFAGGTVSSTHQHTDALGTPVAVTDESRVVVERSEYDPYGALMNRPLGDGLGYTGHVQDAVTGLTYMEQRYYDPQIGRFLSVDPVTANGNTGDNFNRYKYASSNPYRFYDPDGREDKEIRERKDWSSLSAHSSNMSGIGAMSSAHTATSAQRTAIGSMSYRSARTGSDGVENKFYMNDSGSVLGKSQSGCYGSDRCAITKSELPEGTTLAGHLHVYPPMPGSARLPESLRLSREFPGPGDARPLKIGLVSAVIMPSGARYLIEGTASSPTISYLGGGDAVFGAYVQRTWQPEMSDKQIMDSVKSYQQSGP